VEFTKWLRLQWDRVAAGICAGVGLLALLLGWIGVSGVANPGEQMPYMLSGGVTGIFLIGLAAVLWLSADMRDEWRKLDRLEEYMRGNRHPGELLGNGQPISGPFVFDPSVTMPGAYGGTTWVPTGYVPSRPQPVDPAGEELYEAQRPMPAEESDLAYVGAVAASKPAAASARRRPLTASGRTSASQARRTSVSRVASEDGDE
jgi:hypothetical protein